MIRKRVALTLTFAAALACSVHRAAADELYLGTATGGVAVYYNNNGLGETASNIAYLRVQASATNTNGAVFNFDPNLGSPPGYGPGNLFQSVPDQYGLDLIQPVNPTGPVPTLEAYDNGDGNLSGRVDAGPMGWGISFYTGSTDGPANPANQIINTLARGDDGSLGLNDLQQNGTVFTVDFGGSLVTDGLLHWYLPSQADTPFASIPFENAIATGNLIFRGTATYDSSTDTNPLMDFYSGSADVYLEFTPTPEPATLGLSGMALVGLGATAIRRQRSARRRRKHLS